MWSYKIARIWGIPIRIHVTFLLVLPLFVLVFAVEPTFGFGAFPSKALSYLFGAMAAVMLFVSVLLHELGHSLVAMHYGSRISDITLFLFGGVSQIEEVPKDPEKEARMAFVGPLVSFVLGVLFLMAYAGAKLVFAPADVENSSLSSAFTRLLFLLGYLNVLLGAFNLIPAFPMDGGRILRAYFAKHTSYVEATRRAASVGKLLALLMGIVGFFVNIWLVLIAFFVYIGASEEEAATQLSSMLEDVRVKDVMSEEVVYVSPEATVGQLLDLMFETKHMGYPVSVEGVESGKGVPLSRVVGMVTFNDVRKIPPHDREALLVRDIMTPELITIPKDAHAIEALKSMRKNGIGRLLVVDGDEVVGIPSRSDLMRSVDILSLRR
ncbi:MAG: CBS domain containing protein [Euryarchaeota archaeon 55_53]|nr:MAG: CBS domain containing protein [Euryarchaeota archaeon 55_53]